MILGFRNIAQNHVATTPAFIAKMRVRNWTPFSNPSLRDLLDMKLNDNIGAAILKSLQMVCQNGLLENFFRNLYTLHTPM